MSENNKKDTSVINTLNAMLKKEIDERLKNKEAK